MCSEVLVIDGAFPAHAGMNRFRTVQQAELMGVPRTRGDEPNGLIIRVATIERSPHTRG